MSRSATSTDVHVGHVIKAHRALKGLTQDALAAACGISFQQVQKYEQGTNRVSASRLLEIAKVLGMTPAQFFPPDDDAEALDEVHQFVSDRRGLELARVFIAMDGSCRDAVLRVALAIADATPSLVGGLHHVA